VATIHQRETLEKNLREYRKKWLGKSKGKSLNEADTRICVNDFLTDVLGFQMHEEIKTEYAIRGQYADYVIQLKRKKQFVVEVKAMEIDLNAKHLLQATHYAADEGIDWVLLTNGMSLELHRVIFSKPVSDVRIFKFDLSDLSQIEKASDALVNLTKKAVEKGELEEYWKRFDALSPAKLIKTVYTEEIIGAIRRKVKKDSGMSFDQADVFNAVHVLIIGDNKEVTKPKKLK
jgi:predicted type IV restriction endonuclease